MPRPGLLAALALCTFLPTLAQADLTIVQKAEGAGPFSNMTIKIKGTKVRMEAPPQPTAIIDSASGDILYLKNDTREVVRISGAQTKALAGVLEAATSPAPRPKLTATGRTETIDGHETAEYTYESPSFKATYWIAKDFPNAREIIRQLSSATPGNVPQGALGIPDFRDFPGLPLRTKVKMGAQEMTTTIVSVSQEPLDETEFTVPANYKEMKMPDILGGKKPGQSGGKTSPAPRRP